MSQERNGENYKDFLRFLMSNKVEQQLADQPQKPSVKDTNSPKPRTEKEPILCQTPKP